MIQANPFIKFPRDPVTNTLHLMSCVLLVTFHVCWLLKWSWDGEGHSAKTIILTLTDDRHCVTQSMTSWNHSCQSSCQAPATATDPGNYKNINNLNIDDFGVSILRHHWFHHVVVVMFRTLGVMEPILDIDTEESSQTKPLADRMIRWWCMVVCVLNVYKNSNRAIKIQFISDALNMILSLCTFRQMVWLHS